MKNERTPSALPARRLAKLLSIPAVLLLASCGSASSDESTASSAPDDVASTAAATDVDAVDVATSTATSTSTDAGDATAATVGVDVGLFFDGALAEDVTTEDCTLNGGAETTCYSITVAGYPASHDVGPFCPDTITDGAENGGIWFDGEGVYDLDGQFIVDLPTLYDDDQWHMHDDDGNVLVTETAEEFDAAARPDVDPDLENHCVEGRLEWLDNGEAITSTVLIPTVPVAADGPAVAQGNQGITLDGVVIAESAPVEAILGAYTIAAFDDCGGHFNPFEGYHLHGAVGCSEVGDAAEGDTAMFGYAMDGYPVHSPLDDADVEAAGLDECNGHTTDAVGYHYHANGAEQNQVIACLTGQSVASEGGPGGGPGGGPPG